MNDIPHQSYIKSEKDKHIILFSSINIPSTPIDLFTFRVWNLRFNQQNDWTEKSLFWKKNIKSVKKIKLLSERNGAIFIGVLHPLNESKKFEGMNWFYYPFNQTLNKLQAQKIDVFEYTYNQNRNIFLDGSHYTNTGIKNLIHDFLGPKFTEIMNN